MPKLCIQDHTGHSEIEFEKANKVSLAEAITAFDEKKSKGYIAAKKRADGQHELIRSFDPDADMLLMPHLVGG